MQRPPARLKSIMLRQVFEYLVLPPGSVLVLLLIGVLLRSPFPRLARVLFVTACLWLWLASTPIFAGWLLGTLQNDLPLPATGTLPTADAIVVLGAEADCDGREYDGAVIGQVTMQRVRYAAALNKRTQLPVLVSGGKPNVATPSLAALMRKTLQEEFTVPVRWVEEQSANTSENAQFSADLLTKDNKQTVFLVTSAWHEPRAKASFERFGIHVIPATTAFRDAPYQGLQSLIPQWSALKDTSWALHEICGLSYYRLRHGT